VLQLIRTITTTKTALSSGLISLLAAGAAGRTEKPTMKSPKPTPPFVEPCPTVRLAQGELSAVDMCSCGNLRVHLAAMTLRLTPDALASIVDTLGEALTTQAMLSAPVRPAMQAADTLAHATKLPQRGHS
jgi:hypothetical protein